MKMRIVDFERITTHYTEYRKGVNEINKERDIILKRLDPLKKEMESIIRSSQSGLIVDPTLKEDRAKRFQILQNEAIEIETDYKNRLSKLKSSLNIKTYDELSEIITQWGINNSVDIIIGKMEVVYNKPEFESTDDIINLLKSRNLYVDAIENENENESEK